MRPPMHHVATVRATLVAALTLLAGCLSPPSAQERPPFVVDEEFSHSEASWVAFESGGCGLCSGEGGFGPHAEHHAFFVFRDGRLLLVEFNERPDSSNDSSGFHMHENVSYDADQLRALLDAVPRAGAGETWVVRVTTGRALDETLPERLDARWTTPGRESPAADYGATYGHRPPEGEPTVVDLRGPLHEDDPFNEYTMLLHETKRALQEVADARGAASPSG